MTGFSSAISSRVLTGALPGPLTDLVLEVLDRLLPRIRVEVPVSDAATNLARGQLQGPRPRLILYPRNSKPVVTCTIRVFSTLSVTPSTFRTLVASASTRHASARV